MSVQDKFKLLLAITDTEEQQQFLVRILPQLDSEQTDALADLLKESIIHSLRINMQQAVRLADCLLLLAELSESLPYRALGLRTKAQVLTIGQGQHEQALPLYDEAVEIYRTLGDELGQAHVQVTRIWAVALTSEYEKAVTAGEKARVVLFAHQEWRSLATLNNNLAMIHNRFGDLDQALLLLDESRDIYQKLGAVGEKFLTNNETNRAFVLFALGRFKRSIEASERALSLADRFGQVALVARARHNLALTYYVLGHYNRALLLFDQAKVVWLEDGRFQEVIQNELTSTYCLIKLRRFDEVLNKCQNVRRLIQEQNLMPESLFSLLNEAHALAGLNRYDEALDSLAATRQMFQGEKNALDLAQAELARADLLYRQGDMGRSYQVADAAARTFARMNRPIEEAQAHLISARSSAEQGIYDQALSHLRRALALVESRDAAALIFEAYFTWGQIELNVGALKTALSYFERAIDELERLQGWTMVEFRPDFLKDEDKRVLYEKTVSLYLRLQDSAGALRTVERAKSRALMDLIAYRLDLRIRSRSPGDESLVEQLNRLRTQRNQLFRFRVGEAESRSEDSINLMNRQQNIEREITALWHQLLVRNADYANEAAAPARLQPIKLPANTNLVEYFVVDNQILAFLVTAETAEAPQVFHLPVEMVQVERLLQSLQLNLRTTARIPPDRILNLLANAQGILRQMYQLLWEPLADSLTAECTQLVIVPHGSLHYLPFHALYDGDRYLLERYEVSYLPGISFWTPESEPVMGDKASAVIVGYSSNGRLPQAQKEAEMIAAQWPGELLLENEATLERLEAKAQDHAIIHLATHGEFRPDNPLFSGLALADGELTTLDIFDQRLKASLVTLSACNTGRNVIGGGDELLGLMRAFLAAGAASLVLTHWAVADEVTAELMINFYGQLAAGARKSSALQAAQRDILQGGNGRSYYAHPYFWASFFLVGDAGRL